MRKRWWEYVLVEGIEHEDESDDSVGCCITSFLGKDGRAYSLEEEANHHTSGRRQEKSTATDTVHEGRSENCPEQIPNLQDTIDEKL